MRRSPSLYSDDSDDDDDDDWSDDEENCGLPPEVLVSSRRSSRRASQQQRSLSVSKAKPEPPSAGASVEALIAEIDAADAEPAP